MLKKLGLEGWELVGTVPVVEVAAPAGQITGGWTGHGSKTKVVYLIFKRKISKDK